MIFKLLYLLSLLVFNKWERKGYYRNNK